jgi:hypothetical protein
MWWRALLLLAVSTVCAGQQNVACPSGDIKKCLLDAIAASPAKKVATWKAAFGKPLEQRVGPAPQSVIDLLQFDNSFHGYPEKPHASVVSPELQADVVAALVALPEAVKRRLDDRLVGILFVDEFGGTGFTDSILDEDGRKTKAFLVLDPTVLEKRTANSWASWKENTPFKADARYELKATIETPANDTRCQAIQYILLHELGHVLAVGSKFHPDWNLTVSQIPQESYPFFELSWSLDRPGNRYVNKFEAQLPERPNVRYYFGAKLSAADMAPAYRHLEQTNFPTLYAATGPGDDFAESFANYVHVVMLGRPFEIAISEDGRVVERYVSCWKEERCAAKRRILEEYLR